MLVRPVSSLIRHGLMFAALCTAPAAFAATGTCTAGNGLSYVEAYHSATVRWCVEPRVWASNSRDIANFYAYSETMIPTLGKLFGVTLPSPFVFQVDYPNGGAHTGSDFGTGVSVTGDAFYNGYPDPTTGQNVVGFWGYLLTLHEAVNDWTGAVSAGWPTDWWADHRSPFPNSMDYHIMQAIGDQQGNATLQAAARIQHYRFGVVGQSGYDQQVAMDDNFFNNYGGFDAFARTFKIMQGDGVKWDQVAPNPSVLLSEYVIAYLQMGFYTHTDLTQSDFIAHGVSNMDAATPAYTPDATHVRAIADAHCSIAGAKTDPSVSSSVINNALTNLRRGNYAAAAVSSRSCTQAAAGSAPAECGCDTGSGQWVSLWSPANTSGPGVGTHVLHPKNAPNLALDDYASNTAQGAVIDIWSTNGTPAQSWVFANQNVQPAGYFNIAVSSGSYCLTASGANSGAPAQLQACNGSQAQAWRAEAASGGYHLIPANNQSLCLDVQSSGTSNGTPVQVWGCNNTNAQLWQVQ